MATLLERHADQIDGVVSCYDRVIIQGSIPGIGHADGMTSYLYGQHILIYDYVKRFAEPLSVQIKTNAAKVAERAGITIEYVRKASFRKESRIQEVIAIDDIVTAQQLSDSLDIRRLHRALDRFARIYCPVIRKFGVEYHWSIMQAEYATDVIFRRQADLARIYDTIVRTAIHAVKPEQVATFLGRKLTANYNDELGNDFHTRIECTRIRHHMGPASIKMYDKSGLVLRIETTINDVSFFKHYRQVVQLDGTRIHKLASMKKTLYSIDALRQTMAASNQRYLDFVSSIDDHEPGIRALNKISEPASDGQRRYKGLNFFSRDDSRLCEIIVRGEFTIYGLRSRNLLELFTGKSPPQISRIIKRLRVLGILKRVAHTYKYYLTELGKRVVLAGLKLRTLCAIPALAQPCRVT